MIKRKIDNKIESFYKNHNKALLLTGARQTGKTFAIRRFGAENFDSIVEINFVENRSAIGFLDGAADAKEMILRISALAKTKMIPGKTLIFFDEVQEYPEIVTLIKFLVEGDVIRRSNNMPNDSLFMRQGVAVIPSFNASLLRSNRSL